LDFPISRSCFAGSQTVRPGILLVLLSLSSISLAARADTVSVFNFAGASIFNNDPNTVSGSTSIDVTTGVVEAISFTAGGVFQSGVDSQSGPVVYVGSSQAKFSVDAGSLINFTGGAFDLNGLNDLYVGHLTAAAASSNVPEPSSILLFGTGLLGIAAFRKKFHPQSAPASFAHR
jgi:hypothetical protein